MIIVGIQQKPIYAEYGCKPSWQTDTAEGLVIGFLDPITIGGGRSPIHQQTALGHLQDVQELHSIMTLSTQK